MPSKTTWGWLAINLLIIGALIWAFAPRPIEVEAATVVQAPFEQFIEEDGRTQLRERHTLSAPVNARLQRITLKVGDAVAAGDVVAWLYPVMSALTDQRSASENQARLRAAGAGVERASARVERAGITLQEHWLELQRQTRLEAQGFVSTARIDALRLTLSGASRELDAAAAERDQALYEEERARAAASPARSIATPQGKAGALPLRSPVSGVVLRISQSSDNTVTPGTALLDVGDPQSLEVVCELLTPDAAQVQVGQRARIDRWGGPTQTAVVRRVEPAAFTKVSALGVEEQRTKVLMDLQASSDARLGDAYRVSVSIITRTEAAAVQVPVGAVFSHGDGQAVYRIEEGRVHLQAVTLGGRQGTQAWVQSGLTPGQAVVLYPGSGVKEGSRVRIRAP
ncbi:MAG: hypothetical protein RJA34_1675 [Pseudomonadota bacterium]|jgi:HlyD family secretion protein